MSMITLTILQTIGIFCVYSFLTVLLPAMVFGKKLSGRRLSERLLFCFLCGNFFLMYLVFVLELLHISNRVTLSLGTVVPAAAAWIKVNGIPVRLRVEQLLTNIRRFFGGQLGKRNARLHIILWLRDHFGLRILRAWKAFYSNTIEWAFLFVLLASIVFMYGTQLVNHFGYAVSDLPVHNYWINSMNDNHIFVAGVYPFGFHCIMYYMHQVFAIDTYILLRVFGLVQTIYIFLMLLLFLKLCCKTKYLPYAGTIAGVVFGGFNFSTYFRYSTSLPQEFGMIFILPSVYFLFRFFEEKKREIKEKLKAKQSRYCLAAFAMSFAMTLAAHFYDTMIAGLFCIGVAAGYVWWIFRRKYFWNILAAGLLSILVAVLPMGIAFVCGTPLQGSLGWGMEIIKGQSDDGEETDDNVPEADTQQMENVTEAGNALEGSHSDVLEKGTEIKTEQEEKVQSLRQRVSGMAQFYYTSAKEVMQRDMLNPGYGWIVEWIFLGMGALLILGVFFWVIRQGFYGAKLVSAGIYMLLMTTLLISASLGIPALMNTARSVIYYAYSLPIVLVFVGDGVCYLVRLIVRWKKSMQILSLAAAVALIFCIVNQGYLKAPADLAALETNGAVTCLTNIIAEEEDFTYTICSASDERNMAFDHAWHYELFTFLAEMEYYGDFSRITIPTESVYFFIEKIPVNYLENYEGSGQSISYKGADNPLPYGSGVSFYQGERRWIVMSRYYYWAKEFCRLYPNEMSVYYETDEFICYKLKQNTYRLYNLAIDYGFNKKVGEN